MLSNIAVYLQANPTLFLILVGLYALLVGSFLNVVVYRVPVILDRVWRQRAQLTLDLPIDEETESAPFNLLVPRSTCPHCGHQIRAVENIPVLSYLWLRGKCASCRHPISFRYPVVELLTAVVSVVTAAHFGVTITTLAALLLVWALIALAFIDYDHQILPDAITLPFLWLGLLVNSFGLITDLHSAVIGAIGGYLSLWIIYQIFRLVTGKEGMGFGDFKLVALLGAWFGWQLLPLTILLAAFSGAVIGGIYLMVSKNGRDHPIPFGPFLCIAGWIAMLWGQVLIDNYLHFAGLR
jgi:leader peptidase (prepilin peptidase)/N-methyltransferase